MIEGSSMQLQSIKSTALVACFTGFAFAVHAADEIPASTSKPIILQQDEIKFHPAPGLPAGAEIANIRGDIKKAEPYTLRLKLPDCYVIPPHWHTNDEEVTVLSGTFNVGFGDKIDKSKSTALTVGGFQLVPGKAPHYVWSQGTSIVQLDGMGPRDTVFVDPKELAPLFKSNATCPQ
jgi:hypothetical protein